jgi:hypothetical protein
LGECCIGRASGAAPKVAGGGLRAFVDGAREVVWTWGVTLSECWVRRVSGPGRMEREAEVVWTLGECWVRRASGPGKMGREAVLGHNSVLDVESGNGRRV